ncbi:MAG TPA: CPBP family glutamic-type intramembrane protease [Rubrobacteraceae bacterium]|nr:CPBP family glutamic-type intramembrane protease [Rubrobacteraceae bacterium]
MTGVVLYTAATLLIGGLAILAQRARKSRGADVTLIVILLALSFLVAAVGVLTAIGLLLRASGESIGGAEQFSLAAAGVAALAAGVAGLGLCVPPLRRVLGWRLRNGWWADPPVFLALWLFAVILANNAVSTLIFTQVPNVAELFPTGRLSPGTILLSEIPFLIIAVLGVGAGVRRNLRQTLSRLGYGPISVRQLGIVAVFVVGALGLSFLANALFAFLQPDLYRTVGDLSNSLFNTQGLSPVSAVFFALLLGLGAGLGEETLFRGAVQPVLGILPASLLFASMHIQYGPSVLLGFIFLLALGLGLLRRYINTTASFLAHASFNALGVMLAYFFGI